MIFLVSTGSFEVSSQTSSPDTYSQEEPIFARIKTNGDSPHPFVGFTSKALAEKCFTSLGAPLNSIRVITLSPRFARGANSILLFDSDKLLCEYLSAPTAFPSERYVVPMLRGISTYLPVPLLRRLAPRRSHTNRNSMQSPITVAEIDSFITLLCAACEDQSLYTRLEKILTLPDDDRKSLLRYLLADMRQKKAPEDFVAAMECLMSTEISEKAYAAIFKCQRQVKL